MNVGLYFGYKLVVSHQTSVLVGEFLSGYTKAVKGTSAWIYSSNGDKQNVRSEEMHDYPLALFRYDRSGGAPGLDFSHKTA